MNISLHRLSIIRNMMSITAPSLFVVMILIGMLIGANIPM